MNCRGLLLTAVAFPTLVSAQDRIASKLLLEDFRIARTSLEEGHSGIYRYRSKADLDREFDAAAGRINHPMTALEFYRLVAGSSGRPDQVWPHCRESSRAVYPRPKDIVTLAA
jgi:hypothetical protein